MTRPEEVLDGLHRAEWGRLLSLLVARPRRLDLAEDALSEAFARASARWRVDGVPDNPAGWVYRTAHRQLVGWLRSEAVAARKVPLLRVRTGWTAPEDTFDDLPDERLHLILLCCHPALSPTSRSALALRLVLGTPTAQIARLFLVAPTAMAARLTRAKKKIVHAGIPLAAPAKRELRARLDEVCRTIYLAFTAGYAPGEGDQLLRADLAGDALRLASILRELVPGAPQVDALLALLLLQHSRRDARQRDGRLVTLAAQDRTAWHHDEIRAGLALVAALPPERGYAEELRLQALVAAEHARAPTADATDWTAIARRYATLEALTGSPIVRLQRAVAVAEVEGPRAGLATLAALDGVIADHHRLAAVRAELARRAGDADLARASYQRAVELCSNDVERRHLRERLRSLDAPAAPPG
ncbi:MAG: RNA polymerase sigma factor [Sandaracinaceae bacterium]